MMLKRMSWLVFLLPAMSASTVHAGAEDFEKRIASGKASVVDYFLACHPCNTDFNGTLEEGFAFRTALYKDSKATYYIDSRAEHSEYAITSIERIIDTKNGYISIGGADDGLGVTYTGAIFVRADKKRIFAWSYYHEGGDGEGHSFQFFEFTGTKWRDVISEVMPTYSIEDFAAVKSKLELTDEITWEVVLPQHGTTAYLLPHPSYEVSEVEDKANKYYGYIGQNYALELRWDKKAGRFMKGKLLDQQEYEKTSK